MFRVTVVEVFPETNVPQEVKRLEQYVDVLDLSAVIAAVNRKPRKPRAPKVKTT